MDGPRGHSAKRDKSDRERKILYHLTYMWNLKKPNSLFTIVKKWKQPKCPSTDEWIKKMWYIYTMEYYSAIEKNKILPFTATYMDLEGIMLSEISQTEKDKYCMISPIC